MRHRRTAEAARRRPVARDAAKRRKRRTPAEIRGRLLDAARAEFKARGYAGATTAAIARRADVAEIQMFRYFPSKAELFHEAVFAPLRDHFRAFNAMHGPEARDPASIRDRARLYLSELLAFLGEHAKVLASLFATETSPARSKESLETYLNEIAAVMAERAGAAGDIDPRAIGRVAFGAILGCITYKDWLFPNAGTNDANIDRAITEFILAGIGPYSDIGPVTGRRT